MKTTVRFLMLALSIAASRPASAQTRADLERLTPIKVMAMGAIAPGATDAERAKTISSLKRSLDQMDPRLQLALINHMGMALTHHESRLHKEAGLDDHAFKILAISAVVALLVTTPKIASLKAKAPHVATFSVGAVLALATLALKNHSNETKQAISEHADSLRASLSEMAASLNHEIQMEALEN